MIVGGAWVGVLKATRGIKCNVIILGLAGRRSTLRIYAFGSRGIDAVRRIVSNVGVEIDLVLISNRIDLQEAGLCRQRPNKCRASATNECGMQTKSQLFPPKFLLSSLNRDRQATYASLTNFGYGGTDL